MDVCSGALPLKAVSGMQETQHQSIPRSKLHNDQSEVEAKPEPELVLLQTLQSIPEGYWLEW